MLVAVVVEPQVQVVAVETVVEELEVQGGLVQRDKMVMLTKAPVVEEQVEDLVMQVVEMVDQV
jgi:hypothetical protein